MATGSGYIIHYVTSYGTQPSSLAAEYFSTLTESDLPTLYADGYKFLGWYLSNDYNPSTKLEVGQTLQDHGYTSEGAIITFYAYWIENESFLIQGTSLTSIADKIRVLSGTTGNMSLENMKTHIDDANNTINSQSDTIAEITEILNNIGTGNGTNSGTDNIQATRLIKFSINRSATAYYIDSVGEMKTITSNQEVNAYAGCMVTVCDREAYILKTDDLSFNYADEADYHKMKFSCEGKTITVVFVKKDNLVVKIYGTTSGGGSN